MRWARFVREDGTIAYGTVEGESILEVTGSPLVAWEETDVVHDPGSVRLLAPVLPTKIVAFSGAYPVGPKSDEPVLFLKPSTSVIGHEEPIRLPAGVGSVAAEGELAVVVGRVAKAVSPEDVERVVFGYCAANDVTARELQARDGQWARSKGFDTFCPLGPAVVDDIDPSNLDVTVRINGEVAQEGNTGWMLHSVAELVSFASRVMTLLPGDVILTGTPSATPFMRPGDIVEVDIGEVGILRNPVS